MTLLLQAYLSSGRAFAVLSSTTTCLPRRDKSKCAAASSPSSLVAAAAMAVKYGLPHKASAPSLSSSSKSMAHLHATTRKRHSRAAWLIPCHNKLASGAMRSFLARLLRQDRTCNAGGNLQHAQIRKIGALQLMLWIACTAQPSPEFMLC